MVIQPLPTDRQQQVSKMDQGARKTTQKYNMLDKQQVVKNLKRIESIDIIPEHRISEPKISWIIRPFWPRSQVKGARQCSSIPMDVARSKTGGLCEAAKKGWFPSWRAMQVQLVDWFCGDFVFTFFVFFVFQFLKVIHRGLLWCCLEFLKDERTFKIEFEQTFCLGGKLCNKEMICSCFCEVNLAEGILGIPPFWKSSHISTIIHHPMGADCLWFSPGRVCGHFLCTACATELSSQSTNPRCPVCRQQFQPHPQRPPDPREAPLG